MKSDRAEGSFQVRICERRVAYERGHELDHPLNRRSCKKNTSVILTQAMPKRKDRWVLLAFYCGMPSVPNMQALNGIIAALPVCSVGLWVDAADLANVTVETSSFLGLGDARVLCWI